MKHKKIYILLFLILCIAIIGIKDTYARYVINKTEEVNISTSATLNSGSVSVTIQNDKSSYIVENATDTADISAQITLENDELITISSYYAWTTSQTEPESAEWQQFEFTSNTYSAQLNAGIGNYYLWVKIEYNNELGQSKSVIKSSNVVNVILGDIEITLEDENSEFLTGNVIATITYKGEFTQNCKVGYGITEDAAKQNATDVSLADNKTTITIAPSEDEEDDTIYYVYAYAENGTGESISITRAISNIDNVKPTISTVTPTNKRIILNVSDNKSGIKEYTVTNSETEPATYTYTLEKATVETELTISGLNQDTTYYVWVKDAVGNVTTQKVTTQKLTYTQTPGNTEWTNDKVTILFENIDNCTLTYNLDSGVTTSYNTETGIQVDTNCTVNYTLQDGEETVTGSIIISNIDETSPSITTSSDYSKVTITAEDSESGIIGYLVTSTQLTDASSAQFTSCENTAKLSKEVTQDYLENDLVYGKLYYVYVKDSVGNISVSEVTSRIDKINPTITITESSVTTNTIKVTVSAQDNESTLDGTYKYYITATEGEYPEDPIETNNNTYTFENLTHQVTYHVKIEVTDKAGNIGIVEQAFTTNELVYTDGDITFTNSYWSNNINTITLNTTTSYQMQYQIVKSGGSISLQNSDWTGPLNSGDTVTGLEHTDTLYVRLYDGTNSTKDYATYNIINIMAKNYSTITDEDVDNITTGTFDILTYSVDESSATVATSEAKANTLTYNYYTKGIKDSYYTLVVTSSTYNDIATIDTFKKGETYSSIVITLANDTVGTLNKSENRTITIAETQVEAGKYYDENRTYIDSNNYTVTVPTNFTVSSDTAENVIENGLVIKDESGNEFVWIPVEDAIYDETTTLPTSSNSTTLYKPMVRYQSGSSSYYESMYYTFSGTKSWTSTSSSYRLGGTSYIEPSIITGNSRDGYTWNVSTLQGSEYDASETNYTTLGFASTQEFAEYLNADYTNMINSVDTYCGFYVGRYETTNSDGIIGSKANTEILNNVNWYQLYLYQNSSRYENNAFYNSIGMNTTMITGSQYDAMLNFILNGDDNSKITVSNIGNKTNRIANTGQFSEDCMNNIYDLASNAYELTTQSRDVKYRIARGGGYSVSETKTAMTRTDISPEDSGAIIGSRMALYLLETNDNTAPDVDFTLTQTSNSIVVKVTATDEGTGVGDYYYSYSTSANGEDWTEPVVSTSSTYTFEGLTGGTTYYVRVKVSDRKGNVSEWLVKDCTTDTLTLSENDVKVGSIYGKDGEGVAVLEISEDMKNQGYYIEYQIVGTGTGKETSFSETGTWYTGNFATGLCVGDVIYIRLTDGNNALSGYVQADIKQLEEFSEAYETTTKYEDTNGDIAYIPAGFKVGTSSINNTIQDGLVIEDESGNQFVWVPVKNVVYNEGDIPTSESEAQADTTLYRPMARYQEGSTRYYEGMYYTFTSGLSYAVKTYRLGQSNYSEPRLVTGYSNYTWDIENTNLTAITYDTLYATTTLGFSTPEEFGKYMNEEYTNMINSVIRYGGFYIARTETSVSGTTVQSQIGKTPYKNATWYNMYLYQDSNRYSLNPYYGSDSVVSSMIWNSQWNAVLNWALTGEDKEKVSDKTIGNLSDTLNNTGETGTDIINNILDLTGNVSEFNQAGHSTWLKVYRGSSYNVTHDYRKEGTSELIYYGSPMSTYAFIGTRMTLYLTNSEDENLKDETAPTVAFRDELEVTTNSIKVKLEAQDEEGGTGIAKYIYSISSDGGTTYTDYVGYGNTYTFDELTQNHNYKIKVVVEDYAGNKSSELEYTEDIMTKILEIETTDIEQYSLYGKDGEGIAYYTLSDEYEEQGYYLEYQIVHEGESFSENGTWTSEVKIGNVTIQNQANNLKVGDTIYVRITDGVNTIGSSGSYQFNIASLETYSEAYQSLEEYEDENGDKAWIPAGFKVGTSSINSIIKNGLVIENEETGDQFVWVPVANAIYDASDGTIPTNDSNANKNTDENGNVVSYKPMAKYQKGYSSTTTEQYFEGILYTGWSSSYVKGSRAQRGATDYALATTGYREPSLITGSSVQYSWLYEAGTDYDANSSYYSEILQFSTTSDFGEYMNDEYTNMVKSVEKYGGFYVGRYETSLFTESGTSSTNGTIVKTQYNTTPMASINWYKMYYNQDSNRNEANPYYGNNEIVATMIWGSQWDAMLNWILEGDYSEFVYDVTGNHSGTRLNTGVYGNDFANNIIDLSSNVREWTIEANQCSVPCLSWWFVY